MKKVLAVLFILISALLSLAILLQIPSLISAGIHAVGGTSYQLGYFLGIIIFNVISLTIIYLCIKYARRWLKKPITTEVLDAHLK